MISGSCVDEMPRLVARPNLLAESSADLGHQPRIDGESPSLGTSSLSARPAASRQRRSCFASQARKPPLVDALDGADLGDCRRKNAIEKLYDGPPCGIEKRIARNGAVRREGARRISEENT